jgi:hypothetical protein
MLKVMVVAAVLVLLEQTLHGIVAAMVVQVGQAVSLAHR